MTTIDFEIHRGLKKLSDHISSGRQATSNDKSDRQSSMTTDPDSIDDYLIIQVALSEIRTTKPEESA
jgi:hypothetical protein